jgi:hypothetical protein
MRHELYIRLGGSEDVAMHTHAPMAQDEARAWLDGEFNRLGCEPIRPSGKVLSADKVLAVAQAAGPEGFADAAWADAYLRATTGALGRTLIRVDVPNQSVGY